MDTVLIFKPALSPHFQTGANISGTSELKCLTQRCQKIDGEWIDLVLQIESCTAPFPKPETGWRGFRGVASLLGELKNPPTAPSINAVGSPTANISNKAQFLATILVEIKEILCTGVTTLVRVANDLNQRGLLTPNGKLWTDANVYRVLRDAARSNANTGKSYGFKVRCLRRTLDRT